MHLLRHVRGTRLVDGQDSGPGPGRAELEPVTVSMAIELCADSASAPATGAASDREAAPLCVLAPPPLRLRGMDDGGMDIEATDIVVTGRVQGVFYRAGMREQAERLEVAGWVRNEPDGTVTAHLEGSPAAVSEMLDWCASGPPAAKVDDVSAQPAEVTGTRGFHAD